MTTFLPAEKGMTIRVPSTANLMIDSADRDEERYPYASDFLINKSQSIMNGFFTRIGTTEVVMDWSYPNINKDLSNNHLTVDISGSTYTAFITPDFYTVEQALLAVVDALNAGAPAGVVWTLNTALPNGAGLQANATFTLDYSTLLEQLLKLSPAAFPLTVNAVAGVALLPIGVAQPNLVPFRYIDFTSEQLTYNQDLKDDATNSQNRNVLCRWYMAFDQPPALDGRGFPILMGYTPFFLRRSFSPPKQIRWDNTQPLGQIGFKLFIDENSANFYSLANTNFPAGITGLLPGSDFDWLMTLQLSEV